MKNKLTLLFVPLMLGLQSQVIAQTKEMTLKDVQAEQAYHRAQETRKVDGITIKPGYPLPNDTAALMESLQLNRGIELFLWSLPVNQSYAGRDGMFKASGGGMLDVRRISAECPITPLRCRR